MLRSKEEKWSKRVTVWYPGDGVRSRGRKLRSWEDDLKLIFGGIKEAAERGLCRNGEFITGLTLIGERLAAANSNDMSKLDKDIVRITAKAVFFTHNVPWHCDVKDYHIHPEFDKLKLTNTLTILNLNCDRKIWTPLNWPVRSLMHSYENKSNSEALGKIYAVGLSDRNYNFEQVIYGMKFVNSSKCSEFYIKDEINFPFLWPKYCLCFKAVHVKRQCVFDSGMALVSMHNGNWTLIGIGALGPGCILPSRYIDVFPYITWMKKQKRAHKLNYRKQGYNYNSDEDETDETSTSTTTKSTAIDPSKNIISDASHIDNPFYIEKLNDTSMVMRPKNGTQSEKVYGHCNEEEGDIIYRDAGLVKTKKVAATGMYALSLYDMFYDSITCVMVNVVCDKCSKTKFWYEYGFKADNWNDLIQAVPYMKWRRTVPPKILFLSETYYNYERIMTANLVFKFEFTGKAAISVDLYGHLAVTTPRIVTTPTTPRYWKKHRYHMYRTSAYYFERYIKDNILPTGVWKYDW